MARVCDLTGKRSNVANKVSHSNVKTKKRQFPNLQKRQVWFEEQGRWVTLRVSTRVMRTLRKMTLGQFAQKNKPGSFGAVVLGGGLRARCNFLGGLRAPLLAALAPATAFGRAPLALFGWGASGTLAGLIVQKAAPLSGFLVFAPIRTT